MIRGRPSAMVAVHKGAADSPQSGCDFSPVRANWVPQRSATRARIYELITNARLGRAHTPVDTRGSSSRRIERRWLRMCADSSRDSRWNRNLIRFNAPKRCCRSATETAVTQFEQHRRSRVGKGCPTARSAAPMSLIEARASGEPIDPALPTRVQTDPAPVCPRVIDELTPNHRNTPGRPHYRRIQDGLAAGDRAARGVLRRRPAGEPRLRPGGVLGDLRRPGRDPADPGAGGDVTRGRHPGRRNRGSRRQKSSSWPSATCACRRWPGQVSTSRSC